MKSPIILGFPLTQSAKALIKDEKIYLDEMPFEYHIVEKQPELAEILSQTLSTPVPQEEIDKINTHTELLYILLRPESLGNIFSLLEKIEALWKISLPFVYVESAGVSHSKDFWNELLQNKDNDSLVNLFVQMVEQDKRLYTHGMAALGQKDFITSSNDIETAMGILYSTCAEALDSQEEWKDGEKLNFEKKAYRLQNEKQGLLAEEDPMFNPYGYLRIVESF